MLLPSRITPIGILPDRPNNPAHKDNLRGMGVVSRSDRARRKSIGSPQTQETTGAVKVSRNLKPKKEIQAEI